MKKIISMVLALVMVMGLSVTAMAEEGTAITKDGKVVIKDFSQASSNTTSIEIPAKYTTSVESNTDVTAKNYVYMAWTVQSTLEYVVDSNSYTWNVYSDTKGENLIPDTDPDKTKPLSAGYSVKGKWKDNTSAIINVTVENWSNRDVWVKYTLDGANVTAADTATGKVTGVTEAFEFQNVTLPTTQKLTTKADVNSTALITAVNKATPDAIVINASNIKSGAINSNVDSIGTLTVTISNKALQ